MKGLKEKLMNSLMFTQIIILNQNDTPIIWKGFRNEIN